MPLSIIQRKLGFVGMKPIRNDDDLRAAMDQLARVRPAGTNIDDLLGAIQFRMEPQGLTPKDLEVFMGPSGRVSEVLYRKRFLSL
jgi:HTH-type transcriptional regulator/antitoxin HigA